MALRVCIAGAGGRMGRALLEAVAANPHLQLSGALEHEGSALLGKDAGELAGGSTGVLVTADLDAGLQGCDVLIDFTRPEGTLRHVAACRRNGVNAVIGTTGLDAAAKQAIAEAAREIAIVFAPNMSVGVNATFKLVELAAKTLGPDFDIEIIEAHHQRKVDAPSGTALKLGEIAAAALGRKLDEVAVFERHGNVGARPAGSIGFTAIRGGDIVGDHTVLFAGDGERIEIVHRSSNRNTFTQGALRAALFLAARKSGLFDMPDVLGLE